MKIEWTIARAPDETCGYNHMFFKCPVLGKIQIEWKGWKDPKSFYCLVQNGDLDPIIEVCEFTLDAAKAEVEMKYSALKDEFLETSIS